MEFIIKWDAGYGEDRELIEAESLEEAEKYAYEVWLDDINSNANYSATVATDELKEEHGL